MKVLDFHAHNENCTLKNLFDTISFALVCDFSRTLTFREIYWRKCCKSFWTKSGNHWCKPGTEQVRPTTYLVFLRHPSVSDKLPFHAVTSISCTRAFGPAPVLDSNRKLWIRTAGFILSHQYIFSVLFSLFVGCCAIRSFSSLCRRVK
jgi:hypothetical protein